MRNQYDRNGATWVNQPTHPFLADTVSSTLMMCAVN
jgi:hypothetical protein